MKHIRLVALVLAVSACCASLAFADGSGKSAKAAGSADCCGAKSAKAANAGSCSMKGGTTAAASTCPAGGKSAAGAKCDMAGMAGMAHGECPVCTDEMACDNDVRGLNSHAQVVTLRNGAMIVYTADTPENVHALQAALARHNDQIMGALATNSDAKLCGGCKSFRGAMASGKFSRELVNVKTGAQVLLTSSDRAIVERIHAMTSSTAARTKS